MTNLPSPKHPLPSLTQKRLLLALFTPQARYGSRWTAYPLGSGYLGGFLPFSARYIVARTGDPFWRLWYTWLVVLVALIVALWGLPSGKPRDFADDA